VVVVVSRKSRVNPINIAFLPGREGIYKKEFTGLFDEFAGVICGAVMQQCH
jgi:hypothetical protein